MSGLTSERWTEYKLQRWERLNRKCQRQPAIHAVLALVELPIMLNDAIVHCRLTEDPGERHKLVVEYDQQFRNVVRARFSHTLIETTALHFAIGIFDVWGFVLIVAALYFAFHALL